MYEKIFEAKNIPKFSQKKNKRGPEENYKNLKP